MATPPSQAWTGPPTSAAPAKAKTAAAIATARNLEISKYLLLCGAVARAVRSAPAFHAAPSCSGRRLSKPWRRPLIQIRDRHVIAAASRIKFYAALQRRSALRPGRAVEPSPKTGMGLPVAMSWANLLIARSGRWRGP